jgi:cytochrome c553
MTAFAAPLSESDMQQIARYYSSQDGLFVPEAKD